MSALLDISRIDSGALKPSPAPFGVRDLFKKIEVEFAPLAREKQIDLRLVGSSAAALSDRALVARILQNLVSNAIKYTRPGGRVLVGCRRHGARLRLDVIDTGIGFNKDQHALIFAEFSRLEHGARMAQGLGLGLSIVKRLVAALGLGLDLDSAEGKGSRFSLYMPLARTMPPPVETEAGRVEPASNIANLRILCVDNERTILDAMLGLLSGWGCDVRLARSLKDIARDQILVGWLPDLVLMDYHLDQTSGLDAIEWLRQNVGGHLPAALVTADRSPAVRALAEERGIAVVTKPVKPAALRATISGLAGQRPRQAGARPFESNVSN
jgi:CheY-like chemotaxis protein/anti-sigma regulatory factor (Ser/Thr protein kinase)